MGILLVGGLGTDTMFSMLQRLAAQRYAMLAGGTHPRVNAIAVHQQVLCTAVGGKEPFFIPCCIITVVSESAGRL